MKKKLLFIAVLIYSCCLSLNAQIIPPASTCDYLTVGSVAPLVTTVCEGSTITLNSDPGTSAANYAYVITDPSNIVLDEDGLPVGEAIIGTVEETPLGSGNFVFDPANYNLNIGATYSITGFGFDLVNVNEIIAGVYISNLCTLAIPCNTDGDASNDFCMSCADEPAAPEAFTTLAELFSFAGSIAGGETSIQGVLGVIDLIQDLNVALAVPAPCYSINDYYEYSVFYAGESIWYQDIDNDGLGNANVSISSCGQPTGYVANAGDDCDGTYDCAGVCNGSAIVDECGVCNGGGPTIWYQDADNDGLGNPNVSLTNCTQPAGYVSNNNDTNDGGCQGTIDCLGVCNGSAVIDECGVCNGAGAAIWYQDADNDGLGNPNVSLTNCTQPAGYVLNNNDTDDGGCSGSVDCLGVCNGSAVIDECGVCNGAGAPTWYQDSDNDGLGNPNASIVSCTQPTGYVSNNNDTNDGGCQLPIDICGICGGSGESIYYLDNDNDGLGDPNNSVSSCFQPFGYVSNNSDTDDSCSAGVDACGICGGPGQTTYYFDNDGDGLGDPNNSTQSCAQPAGYVTNSNDTNDGCNGLIDACGVCNGPGQSTYYFDNDGDGLGDPNSSTQACSQPAGYVTNGNDTNDSCNGTIDVCGVCNGAGESIWYLDADGDGLGNPNATLSACTIPAGYVSNGNDPNDSCNGVVDACGVCNGDNSSCSGCTDANACNYDSNATVLDASCIYPNGCTDPIACNYDPNATCDNGGCNYGLTSCPEPCNVIYGCTDPTACNYDSEATCDLGTCGYGIVACPNPCNVTYGCIDPSACNYNVNADCDNGSCEYGNIACSDPCNEVFGCTDATACNYDSAATCEDESCDYGLTTCPDPCNVVFGCTNASACNFDPTATCDNETCDLGNTSCPDPCNVVFGCTDATACNYDSSATCEDGSCDLGNTSCPDPCTVVFGCIDAAACNYDSSATCDDGTCDLGNVACPDPCNVVFGCTDALACNYDSMANCDDDSCDFPNGCTDAAACNYDSSATCDDGSCDYGITTCPDPCNVVLGCSQVTACNYDPAATCDDGSCDLGNTSCPDPCNVLFGCIDVAALNYDPAATCDDASCIYGPEGGCTDPCAANFDSNAEEDDGSCLPYDTACNNDCTLGDLTIWDASTCSCVLVTESIVGCTDPLACNFDPAANCNSGCEPCPECNLEVVEDLLCSPQNNMYQLVFVMNGASDGEYGITNNETGSTVFVNDPYYISIAAETENAYSYTVFVASEPDCSQTFSSASVSCIVTSVELLDFNGINKSEGNFLSWSTATETDSESFILERMNEDGRFIAIAELASSGNSNTELNYSFLDQSAGNKVSYYRLSEKSMDGKIEVISSVIAIERNVAFNSLIEISPIPANDFISVNYAMLQEGVVEFAIYDITGKQIETIRVLANQGSNNFNVDISSYAIGNYFLQMKHMVDHNSPQSSSLKTARFVKN